ncbi:glycosyltransferase family 2 protein [Mucilaginibacter lacusdianchii]|uniref:glycosyltransferase family 2 protein n=1 Tax=Mucilaginibacter lacusdianchii TaxID=2684211 RepID=UPI00131EAC68|nr:glycosyltransferase family 2 protein [Mucilaginibacter sp. JXJ CY 39]
MPKVTIIVPTYNRADLIGETLNSVRQQLYTDWECVIADDHSTDDTAGIVEQYSNTDKRFKYFLNQRTKGAQGARNTGIDKATGEFVVFLDSDDLLADNCLLNRIAFVEQHPDLDFYCFATGVMDKKPFDRAVIWNYLNTEDDDLIRFLRQDMPWHTSGVLWKKDTLVDLGGWDEAVFSWQDWDIHLKSLIGGKYRYMKSANNAVDSFYRLHSSDNAISVKGYTPQSLKARMYLIEKYFSLLPLDSDLQKIEFARLAYRQAVEVALHLDRILAVNFLKGILTKLKFSKLYVNTWCTYLNYRYNQSLSQNIKKFLKLVPKLFGDTALTVERRTHMQAVLK